MKRIIILIAVFSMVICSCNREENPKTVSKSGSGAAVDACLLLINSCLTNIFIYVYNIPNFIFK